MTKVKRLDKDTFLKHFRSLRKRQSIKPAPMPYKHSGSSYSEDGIRITGSREFIDSVLSHLTELLDYENEETRLDVNYTEQVAKTKDSSGKPVYGQQGINSWVCYLKVAERGHEAKYFRAVHQAMVDLIKE